ncbi:hypothetical protein LTR78_003806 [Recurvomyces mirabilis]|uniref:Phytanoyl-CoA dioxygenase family protein n=1 Tax=Recurvomyces mirabilis TaxID=574656 RepID=A0AAE1C3H3_9PEZI|nr:hypothetical protein LTR78_003806 [Recurvomyces mirabilis]KAK5154918.1 hypothetical protein LTS14_006499 [Recurvomyces mirabilis]
MPPRQRTQALTALATATTIAGLAGTLYYLDIPSILRQRVKSRKVEPRCYDLNSPPSLADLKILTQESTVKETYPRATRIETNIPIYDCSQFDLEDKDFVNRLQDEWYHILLSGPGVYILQNFYPDTTLIDNTNAAYAAIATREKAESGTKGDHFSAAQTNTRIWNSLSKHCLQDPTSFIKYHSNPHFRLVCESWLGPAYRITSQVNIVKPGGQAQTVHRDYHLGFQTPQGSVKWPKRMHVASQFLTLQGAVAHTDMPIESGPTRFLPFSQMFEEGYLAYRLPEFQKDFQADHVSLPLKKGDAVFFNPALFHAAGENTTKDFERSANLIQVSSAFGKTMEGLDSIPMVEACWDLLVEKYKAEGCSQEVDALIRAIGEGYSFPTNLDSRPPAPGGMAPESEQDLLSRGLDEGWSRDEVVRALRDMRRDSVA